MGVIYLLRDRLDDSRKKVVLPLLVLRPRGKEPHLAIVTIVGQPHFWADK